MSSEYQDLMKEVRVNADRILVVEDDEDSAEVLVAYLRREGFQTLHVTDGLHALDEHARWQPDLVLLDVMLPGLDGYKVMSAIRQHAQTPVIMVTAVGDPHNRINSLLYGADDYVVKPYDPAEVVARVHAVMRRWRAISAVQGKRLKHRNLVVDTDSVQATVWDGDRPLPIDLTKTEFSLLVVFMTSPARMFTRAELFASCLPESNAMERVVDAHISNLRRKLEQAGVGGVLLPVRGMGYRFRCET